MSNAVPERTNGYFIICCHAKQGEHQWAEREKATFNVKSQSRRFSPSVLDLPGEPRDHTRIKGNERARTESWAI